MNEEASTPLKKRVLSGLIWQGMARGGDRVARLITNIILARILAPEDFGLMGAVAATLAIVEATTFMAVEQSVVQNSGSRKRNFLDTVFWVASIRGLALSLVILSLAPVAAWYYGKPEAINLFLSIAVQPLFMGLLSPKVFLLVKDMRFRRWAVYRTICSVIGMTVSIIVALIYPSAWALLLGHLTMVGAQTIGSYVVCPYLPRLVFDKSAFRELRIYAFQAAGTPLLMVFFMQAPALIIGRIAGLEVYGTFFLIQRLFDMPTQICQQIIGSVAFPAYSEIQSNRKRLREGYLTTLSYAVMVAAPIAIGLGWTGEAFPVIVYGKVYTLDYEILILMATTPFFTSVATVTSPVFWAIGEPRLDRNIQFFRVVLVYAAGVPLTYYFGTVGMAVTLLCTALISAIGAISLIPKIVGTTGKFILLGLQKHLFHGFALFSLLMLIHWTIEPEGLWRLIIAALCSASSLLLLAAQSGTFKFISTARGKD